MVRGVTAPPDLTRLVERLAAQMERAGARHPVAAAVAIACRGRAGVELPAFAQSLGLDPALVSACEAGDVPFGDLPAALVAEHAGLDLLALADLDRSCEDERKAGGG
jgi:hypothetical protein